MKNKIIKLVILPLVILPFTVIVSCGSKINKDIKLNIISKKIQKKFIEMILIILTL